MNIYALQSIYRDFEYLIVECVDIISLDIWIENLYNM